MDILLSDYFLQHLKEHAFQTVPSQHETVVDSKRSERDSAAAGLKYMHLRKEESIEGRTVDSI
jgi:hypothetical protein